MKLSRTDWKYLLDTLMFLCLLGIVAIGLLLAFVIPEGRAEIGRSKYVLGLHRHQWGHIHLYLSLAFASFVVVHIVLAWSWIKGKASALFGKSWMAALGLTALAAVIVPLFFWLAASKNDPAYAEFGTGRGRQTVPIGEHDRPHPAPQVTGIPDAPETRPPAVPAGEEVHENRAVAGRMEEGPVEAVITGQMSLRDIERATGVPAKDIAARIGLPADASLDETLGRLRRAYGFEMERVRSAVADLLKAKRPSPAA